jgi:predicted PurR-regulated permease PerM
MARGVIFRRPMALAFSFLAAWAAWMGLQQGWTILLLGFVAVLLAVVLSFPVGWLAHLHLHRAVAAVLVALLTLGAAGGLVALAAPPVVDQAKELMTGLPDAAAKVERWMRHAQRDRTVKQLTNGKDVAGMVKDKVPGAVETVATFTLPMTLRVLEAVSTFVLLVVLAAFLVAVPTAYRDGLRAMLPRSWERGFDVLWERLGTGLRGWAAGTLVAMAAVGALVAGGLFFIGVDGWLILGLLTFIGVSVPFLGSVASSVPGLLVALAQSPHHFWMALGVYLVAHLVEGYCIQPVVMKRAVRLNPALLLFFQALMGALFGLLGLVVATPLLTVLQITVTTLWIERRLHKRAPGESPEEGAAVPSPAPVPAIN